MVEQISCSDAYVMARPSTKVVVVGGFAKHLVPNMTKEGSNLAGNDLTVAPRGIVTVDSGWMVTGCSQLICMMNDVEVGMDGTHPGATFAMLVLLFLCLWMHRVVKLTLSSLVARMSSM